MFLAAVDLTQWPVWDPNPDLVHLGPLTIRYYGVLFATGLFLGYLLWRWQMQRAGHNRPVTERFLVWGVVAVLAGARLGHCFLYEPEKYLRDPVEILWLWKGGLASHGATVGLIAGLVGYALLYRFSIMEVFDRFAMSVTMGAIFVRLGNFMNAEIVGREWHGPWAVRFPRYELLLKDELLARGHQVPFVPEALPRHPSQLYEAAGALVVFLVLLLIDRILKEKRPRGLMAGLILLLYFSFRFVVEGFKEYQRFFQPEILKEDHIIRLTPTSGLTEGQWYSIPFIALGLAFVAWSLWKRLPASLLSPKVDISAPAAPAAPARRKRR